MLKRDKKKYHHGDLREQLVEAVRQLIEAHGIDGFSVAEACRMAGVSTAAMRGCTTRMPAWRAGSAAPSQPRHTSARKPSP